MMCVADVVQRWDLAKVLMLLVLELVAMLHKSVAIQVWGVIINGPRIDVVINWV